MKAKIITNEDFFSKIKDFTLCQELIVPLNDISIQNYAIQLLAAGYAYKFNYV